MINLFISMSGLSNAQWAQYQWSTMSTGSNYQPYYLPVDIYLFDSPVDINFFIHLLISTFYSPVDINFFIHLLISIFLFIHLLISMPGWSRSNSVMSVWPLLAAYISPETPPRKKQNRNRKRDPVYKVLEKRQNRNRQIKEMPPGGSHLGFAG